jgi:hypothetical protein
MTSRSQDVLIGLHTGNERAEHRLIVLGQVDAGSEYLGLVQFGRPS